MSRPAKELELSLALAKITNKAQMIREVRGVITTQLLIFKDAIDEQDTSLRFLTDQICICAAEAEENIQAFIEKDKAYKRSMVQLGLSFIKLGLSIVGAQEIIEIAESLQSLAESSIETGVEKIEEKLDKIVENIGQNVVRSEEHAIEEAEAALLASSDAKSIKTAWLRYCDTLHKEAKEGINHVLESVKSDDFVWCAILSCIEKAPQAEPHEWVTQACAKAEAYVKTIYQALEPRTQRITTVKDNALKAPEELTDYFTKKGLIDYTCAHKHKSGMQAWVSSKLGSVLSKHFPTLVFQRKFRPLFLGTRKRAIKRREAMNSAQIQLRALPNTTKTKDKLYEELGEKEHELYNGLVKVLRANLPEQPKEETETCRPISPKTVRGRTKSDSYSFARFRRSSLFGEDTPLDREDSRGSYDAKMARRKAIRSYSLDDTAEKQKSPPRSHSMKEKKAKLHDGSPTSHNGLPAWQLAKDEGAPNTPKRSRSVSFKRTSMFLPPTSPGINEDREYQGFEDTEAHRGDEANFVQIHMLPTK